MPQVSVVLPVRNGERTLLATLLSLRAQTLADFEVLVVDDGSDDGSAEAAAALEDPRIRLLGDASHKGLAARLNEGIGQARAPVIARMDADDLCFPERLERQLRFLQTNPSIDLVGCRAVVFGDGGTVIGALAPPATHAELVARPWNNIPLPHPSWMGRATWFRKHLYRTPEVLRAEDQELLLRAMPDSRYACLPDILLAYRQGRFRLAPTLLARRTLAAAQYDLLTARGQPLAAKAAVAVALCKAAIDILAAVPGAEQAFFFRMRGAVSQDVRNQLHAALMATAGP